MAKTPSIPKAARIDKELAKRLHASGIRSSTADLISRTTDGRRRPAKQVRAVIKEMRKVLADVEDRATGGPAKRSAAAKKAAQTRKANAAKRSPAKKTAAGAKKTAARAKAKATA